MEREELTQQQRSPHAKLVECRNAVEKVLKLTRRHAAVVCNRLSHKQVEAVLAAGDDAEKVTKAVEFVEPDPAKEEPKTKTTTKK